MSGDTFLRPSDGKGWFAGLRNMLRKESARWWNFRSILLQALVWLIIVNGLVAFMIFVLPMDPAVEAGEINGEPITIGNSTNDILAGIGINVFFSVASFAFAIGAVILCHDAVLKERETGTAAWVLSKPVSRRSFVLSKFAANGVGILALIVALQGTVAFVLCSLRQGAPVSLLPFVAGLALLGLCCLFYGFLAIATGTLMNSRAAALAVPLIVLLGSAVMYLMPPIGAIMPWKFVEVIGGFAVTGILPPEALPSIAATVAWIAVFVIATVWRFERIEL
jgi:ABC-2 type transport system permease protein